MNKCHFIGEFVAQPQLTHIDGDDTQNPATVTNFTLGITRRFKKSNGSPGSTVDYLDFEAWDSGAKAIVENFKAGDRILVHAIAKSTKHGGTKFRVVEFERMVKCHND